MRRQSGISATDLPLDIRPELGTEIADEIEREVERSLHRAQARGIQPAGIPLVREKGGAVVATQTPRRECLAAAVGARQYGSTECMGRSAPKSGVVRPEVSRVLVQRRIQTEGKNGMDPGGSDRRGKPLAVGADAPSPLSGGVKILQDSRVCSGLRHPGNRDRTEQDCAENCHRETAPTQFTNL